MLREPLVRIGAGVVRHGKCATLQLAEVVAKRELFVATIDHIRRFGVSPQLVERGWTSGETLDASKEGRELLQRATPQLGSGVRR